MIRRFKSWRGNVEDSRITSDPASTVSVHDASFALTPMRTSAAAAEWFQGASRQGKLVRTELRLAITSPAGDMTYPHQPVPSFGCPPRRFTPPILWEHHQREWFKGLAAEEGWWEPSRDLPSRPLPHSGSTTQVTPLFFNLEPNFKHL